MTPLNDLPGVVDGRWDPVHTEHLLIQLGAAVVAYLAASDALRHARVQSTIQDYDEKGDLAEYALEDGTPPPDDYMAARLVIRAMSRGDTPDQIFATHPWLRMLAPPLGDLDW